MNILAISGSLRAASLNSAFLRAACQLAPEGMKIDLFQGLGELPLFNPDLAPDSFAPVHALYHAVGRADALLIASPEYAHGVSGVMKNTLDWLVGYEDFGGKAVAVVNISARAQHADAALREILNTMAAFIVDAASVTIPIGAGLDEYDMVHTKSVADAITAMLAHLQQGVLSRVLVEW